MKCRLPCYSNQNKPKNGFKFIRNQFLIFVIAMFCQNGKKTHLLSHIISMFLSIIETQVIIPFRRTNLMLVYISKHSVTVEMFCTAKNAISLFKLISKATITVRSIIYIRKSIRAKMSQIKYQKSSCIMCEKSKYGRHRN